MGLFVRIIDTEHVRKKHVWRGNFISGENTFTKPEKDKQKYTDINVCVY